VGEVMRRIISKAVLSVLKLDILEAAGPLQLCAGQDAGSEAAVHAMRSIFSDSATEAVLLVDASNAFNCLNRKVALHNMRSLCPPLATILINTYRRDVSLFIDNRQLLSSEGTTQGDPLAMAMYSISVTPLIRALNDSCIRQVWFADDATAGGTLCGLFEWWTKIKSLGAAYGYYPNASKTWLIVKPEFLGAANKVFRGTGVNVTADGRRHLGAALGCRSFTEQYMKEKMDHWLKSVHRLSGVAKAHPHAAYCAFVHGLCNKWTYFMRTIPEVSGFFAPLEEGLSQIFIPALTDRSVNEQERALFALPVRLGGLGIRNFPECSDDEFAASLKVTSPLVEAILKQQFTFDLSICDVQRHNKSEIITIKHEKQGALAVELRSHLSSNLQRTVSLASEKGASSWLSALPVEEHGFALHKAAFRDALCLRYGWLPTGLATNCVCGQGFSVDHAMNCPTGGFPTLRHNELRDFTATVLAEVCRDVRVEPPLQPLTGETLRFATANREDEARVDVCAAGFWGCKYQKAFFDVKVFNANASSYCGSQISSLYRRFEREKQRKYEQRIREVEMGSFTPLVFSTFGGMGHASAVFYKRLAFLVSLKRGVPYNSVMSWLRCRISFSLLRSAIMCLRGARSHQGWPLSFGALDLALAEGQVAPAQ